MRVPDKIRSGENFKRAILNWSNQIVDYLNATKITGDHKTVAISETASGIVIKSLARKTGGPVYATGSSTKNGMFHVALNSETGKLDVKWDHSETLAGHIYLNLKHYEFPKGEEIDPEEGYLCLCIDTDGNNKTYEIVNAWPDMPIVYSYYQENGGLDSNVETVRYPIAQITQGTDPNTDAAIWSIYQLPIYQPPHLHVWGQCTTTNASASASGVE